MAVRAGESRVRIEVMFGKHGDAGPERVLVSPVFIVTVAGLIVVRSSSGDRSGPDIDHESDQVP